MNVIAAILFFYVFGLSAVILTGYIIWLCMRFLRGELKDSKEKQHSK